MRVVRKIVHLCALMALLLPGVCSSSAISKKVLPAEHVNFGVTRTPDILATRPGNPAKNPVHVVVPVRLVIPSTGITALIEPVGIRPESDLATPTRHPWEDVGWYDLGPYPGERGSAVIDGHLDRPGGYPAVFWRLHDVQIGDDVQVTNNAGKTLHFRVTRVAYYTPEQAPLQDIFGNLGGTYLNLISCAGDWIPNQHQTTLRLVVYTVFV